ncbi:MAG TPA: hypothetical protein VFL83_12650 [Anaeromyxobacter sp.]|nr:hypothetical protein [Anaeromyxobacter sp.]
MPRPILLALAAVAALTPAASPAQEGAPAPVSTGLTASVSMGGGGELGLDSGKAGVLELEAAVGYEITSVGLRPELALAFGLEPDTHVALRPGVRWSLPEFPIQLRAAIDLSNARDSGLRWRWLLVGAAAEVRLTSLFGLYGEIDTGVPLGSESGLPLLLRGGASFRF